MENRIFLACHGKGITRATGEAGGTWSVDHLLPEVSVTCLASDPADGTRVYAGTRERGVWASEDHGQTWKPRGMGGQIVKSLAVSPHNPDLIFVGSKPALIYRSRDGGRNWAELEGFRRIPNRWWWFSPAEPPDFRPYVIAIAPSPTEPDVLLAGVEFGAVVRSEDGGETWSRYRSGALRDCHSLKFHATSGDRAYEAGGTGGGAAISEDGGQRQLDKSTVQFEGDQVFSSDPQWMSVIFKGLRVHASVVREIQVCWVGALKPPQPNTRIIFPLTSFACTQGYSGFAFLA